MSFKQSVAGLRAWTHDIFSNTSKFSSRSILFSLPVVASRQVHISINTEIQVRGDDVNAKPEYYVQR